VGAVLALLIGLWPGEEVVGSGRIAAPLAALAAAPLVALALALPATLALFGAVAGAVAGSLVDLVALPGIALAVGLAVFAACCAGRGEPDRA